MTDNYHAIAQDLAIAAGARVFYSLRENRAAAKRGKQAYSVYLRDMFAQKRGKHTFTIIPAFAQANPSWTREVRL